ncbi:hypothetical protein GGX14DRAFT_399280 [Mycena pura]|uniref:Uncharacterized protein n=1 Tax=Mycena pura TaxID=153505 RepID=A0AAD6V4S1_9AGAR|nr:hypothetical protein GGX14DRAFT_399280 [Mycena pura]
MSTPHSPIRSARKPHVIVHAAPVDKALLTCLLAAAMPPEEQPPAHAMPRCMQKPCKNNSALRAMGAQGRRFRAEGTDKNLGDLPVYDISDFEPEEQGPNIFQSGPAAELPFPPASMTPPAPAMSSAPTMSSVPAAHRDLPEGLMYAVSTHNRVLQYREKALKLWKETPGSDLLFTDNEEEICRFIDEFPRGGRTVG